MAEAVNEAITLCLPSAIVSLDAEATAVTIVVKDEDLSRSLISLGIDEYNCRYGSRHEPAPGAAQGAEKEAMGGGLKELFGSLVATIKTKLA